MAEKNTANIGFEKQIWDAACVLWGHIPAAEYRKVIVGLIFLRYISSAFEKRYNELVAEGDGFEDEKDAYLMENIFFVPEEARWNTISSAAHTPEIGTVIDDAMRAIETENKSLKNVLPKNYASPDLDKRVLGEVVDLFTNMDMSDTEDNKDILGRTYEYCIAQFAAYEGVKGGEFYTPSSVVRTLVEILKPFEDCRVYDPCCGSGGMFVQSAKFIEAHQGSRNRISVYGQESNADTWKMAKMNMAIRGIDADFGPYQADTFFDDLHKTLKADFILANPPFNLSNWGQDKLLDDIRWKYGVPPAGNANYAWIQHMIHHLAPNGKIGLVLANGALSTQTSGEGEIRKRIIEDDLIEGIVAMPTQLFYSVTIPVTLWFIPYTSQPQALPVTTPTVEAIPSTAPVNTMVPQTQESTIPVVTFETVPSAVTTVGNSYPNTNLVTGPTFRIKGTQNSNFSGLNELVEQTTAYAQEHQRESANLALAMQQYGQQSGYPSNVAVYSGPIFDIDMTYGMYPSLPDDEGYKA